MQEPEAAVTSSSILSPCPLIVGRYHQTTFLNTSRISSLELAYPSKEPWDIPLSSWPRRPVTYTMPHWSPKVQYSRLLANIPRCILSFVFLPMKWNNYFLAFMPCSFLSLIIENFLSPNSKGTLPECVSQNGLTLFILAKTRKLGGWWGYLPCGAQGT